MSNMTVNSMMSVRTDCSKTPQTTAAVEAVEAFSRFHPCSRTTSVRKVVSVEQSSPAIATRLTESVSAVQLPRSTTADIITPTLNVLFHFSFFVYKM